MNIEKHIFDKINKHGVLIPDAVMAMLKQDPEIERPEEAQRIISHVHSHEGNWYKEARLVRQDDAKGGFMLTQCQYCKKWATNPYGVHGDHNSYVWKSPEEMDSEEKESFELFQDMYNDPEMHAKVFPSHGTCDDCFFEHEAPQLNKMYPPHLADKMIKEILENR